MEPLPRFYFSVEACEVFYKMRYILWVAAPLAACDVIQDCCHLGPPSWILPKIRNERRRRKKKKKPTGKIEHFDAGYVEYHVIKHFALLFVNILCCFKPNKG